MSFVVDAIKSGKPQWFRERIRLDSPITLTLPAAWGCHADIVDLFEQHFFRGPYEQYHSRSLFKKPEYFPLWEDAYRHEKRAVIKALNKQVPIKDGYYRIGGNMDNLFGLELPDTDDINAFTYDLELPSTELVVDTVVCFHRAPSEEFVKTMGEQYWNATIWRLYSIVDYEGKLVPLYRVNTSAQAYPDTGDIKTGTMHRVARNPYINDGSIVRNGELRSAETSELKHCHPEVFFPEHDNLWAALQDVYDTMTSRYDNHWCPADAFDLAGSMEAGKLSLQPVEIATSISRGNRLRKNLERVLTSPQSAKVSWVTRLVQRIGWTGFVGGDRPADRTTIKVFCKARS